MLNTLLSQWFEVFLKHLKTDDELSWLGKIKSFITTNMKVEKEKEKKERRPFMVGFNETFGLIASTLMAILLAKRL